MVKKVLHDIMHLISKYQAELEIIGMGLTGLFLALPACSQPATAALPPDHKCPSSALGFEQLTLAWGVYLIVSIRTLHKRVSRIEEEHKIIGEFMPELPLPGTKGD